MAKYASDERLTFTDIRRETGSLYYSQDMESFATGLKRIPHLCDVAGCKVDYRKDAYERVWTLLMFDILDMDSYAHSQELLQEIALYHELW